MEIEFTYNTLSSLIAAAEKSGLKSEAKRS